MVNNVSGNGGVQGTNSNSNNTTTNKKESNVYGNSVFEGLQKPNTAGMSAEDAKTVMHEYNILTCFASLEKKMNLFTEFFEKTGKSTTTLDNGKDDAFNYVNNNSDGNSPVAKSYYLTTGATFVNDKNSAIARAYGQQEIQGNNTPIGNTLQAFLLNNNEESTAFIGNTTPDRLAENIMQSGDNIITGDAPNIERTDNGEIIATHIGDKTKTMPIKDVDARQIMPEDGKLDSNELYIMKAGYGQETKGLKVADALNAVSNESAKRTTSASTVDIDKNDPYDSFFKKAGEIDGKEGVTKEELTKALSEISTEKNGGLFFDNEKLKNFLQGNN